MQKRNPLSFSRNQKTSCLKFLQLALLIAAVSIQADAFCQAEKQSAKAAAPETKSAGAQSKIDWAIALHAGASKPKANSTEAEKQEMIGSLKEALSKGVEVLKKGGSSLDAVEQVVLAMENDPKLNAGKGAVFNIDGGHELHASIMDGKTHECGGVAAVETVKHPVSLARKIMTDSPYVLMGGKGAEKFAADKGLEIVDPSYFDTDYRRQELEKAKAKLKSLLPASGQNNKVQANAGSIEDLIGTVGCVALDKNGNLAAATSTGGVAHKAFGRIGDSGIIGAGNYADNDSCAVSCTGIGEHFIRNVVAYDLAALIKYKGLSLEKAAREVINSKLGKDTGALVAVDKSGNIVMVSNRGGMRRAAADSSGRLEAFFFE